jgi:hypothetical protein
MVESSSSQGLASIVKLQINYFKIYYILYHKGKIYGMECFNSKKGTKLLLW